MDYPPQYDVTILSQAETMSFDEYMDAVEWSQIQNWYLQYDVDGIVPRYIKQLMATDDVAEAQSIIGHLAVSVTNNRWYSALAAPVAMACLLGILERPAMLPEITEEIVDMLLYEDTLGALINHSYYQVDSESPPWSTEEIEIGEDFAGQSRAVIERSRNQATAYVQYFANHIGRFYSLLLRQDITQITLERLCGIFIMLGRVDILSLLVSQSTSQSAHNEFIQRLLVMQHIDDPTIQQNAAPLLQALEQAVLIPLSPIVRDRSIKEQMAYRHVVPLSLWEDSVTADDIVAVFERIIASRQHLLQQTLYIDDLCWQIIYLPYTHEIRIDSRLDGSDYLGVLPEVQSLNEVANKLIDYARIYQTGASLPFIEGMLISDASSKNPTYTLWSEVWLYQTYVSANQFDRSFKRIFVDDKGNTIIHPLHVYQPYHTRIKNGDDPFQSLGQGSTDWKEVIGWNDLKILPPPQKPFE